MKEGKPSAQADEATQQQYDDFLANGFEIIYDPKIAQQITQRIQSHQDPVDAIAETTLDIVQRIEVGAEKQGIKLKENVLTNGANQLMGAVIEVAEDAGMEPLTDEQKHQAYSLAVSMYLDGAVKSGKLSRDELVQSGREMGQTPEGQKIAQQIGGM